MDGYISNAVVTDGSTPPIEAKYQGEGVYRFSSKPQKYIKASGGFFDSGLPNKGVYIVSANAYVISPITSFLYKHEEMKPVIQEAMGDNVNLYSDYIAEKSFACAKLSQILYVIMGKGADGELAESLTSKNPSSFEDLLENAVSVVEETSLIHPFQRKHIYFPTEQDPYLPPVPDPWPSAGDEKVISLGKDADDKDMAMKFVWVPAGKFQMEDESVGGHDDERPVYEVTTSQGFWMGKYEVT